MDVAPPPAEAAGQGGGEGRPFWLLEGAEKPPKGWNDTNLAFALLHNITYEYNPHKRGRAGGPVPRTRPKQGLLGQEVEVYHAVAKAYRWTMNNLNITEAKEVGGQGVRRTLLLLLKLCVALRLRDRTALCEAKAGSIGFDCTSDSVKAFRDSNWTATDCLAVRLPYPVALRQVMRGESCPPACLPACPPACLLPTPSHAADLVLRALIGGCGGGGLLRLAAGAAVAVACGVPGGAAGVCRGGGARHSQGGGGAAPGNSQLHPQHPRQPAGERARVDWRSLSPHIASTTTGR